MNLLPEPTWKITELVTERPRIIAVSSPRASTMRKRTRVNRHERNRTCKKCGNLGTSKNPVTYAPDPYESEINCNDTPLWMCKNCRDLSRDEGRSAGLQGGGHRDRHSAGQARDRVRRVQADRRHHRQ
jgi:hypothetical protein